MVSNSSPILSIIIPSFNQFEGLKKTLGKVKGFSEVEIVVVDGGSSDGSAQWILDNQSDIDKIRVAPDNGIYDAMNKGIELSSGRWLWFLGTGDMPKEGAIDNVLEHIKSDSESDIHGFGVKLLPPLEPGVPGHYTPNFSGDLKWRNTLHHQGAIYRKSSMVKYMYDTRFKILADYHLNLKLWSDGALCICHDFTIAEVDAGGVSRVFNRILYAEERLLKKDALGGGISAMVQAVWTNMKYLKKQLAKISPKADS